MNHIVSVTPATKLPCPHVPECPAADAPDHDAAHIRFSHHDQGFVVLCNYVVVFDDTGELVDAVAVAPHRPAAHYAQAV